MGEVNGYLSMALGIPEVNVTTGLVFHTTVDEGQARASRVQPLPAIPSYTGE